MTHHVIKALGPTIGTRIEHDDPITLSLRGRDLATYEARQWFMGWLQVALFTRIAPGPDDLPPVPHKTVDNKYDYLADEDDDGG